MALITFCNSLSKDEIDAINQVTDMQMQGNTLHHAAAFVAQQYEQGKHREDGDAGQPSSESFGFGDSH